MLGEAAGAPMPVADPHGASRLDEIMAEIRSLRAEVAQRGPLAGAAETRTDAEPPQAEVRKLKIELDVIGEAIRQTKTEISTLQEGGFDGARVARVAQELRAVVSGAESATEQILKAAEYIDETASTLCAALKNGHEQGLAQDIQDRVTQIFEACNFHDLTGQRITKAVATLALIEDHIARMTEIWSVIERFSTQHAAPSSGQNGDGFLNGPKLDGDHGHSSQDDIDALFH